MRPCVCEYCGQTDTKTVQVRYLFGILTCDEHYAWGVRDCRAYMHKYSLVRMSDAMVLPGLSEMLQMIIDKNSIFPVVRTNGKVEVGWRVYDPALECLKKNNGEWYIPCVNKDMILKPVKLINFLRPDILPLFPAEFPAAFARALAILNSGVYVKGLVNSEPVDLAESPCVTVVQMQTAHVPKTSYQCTSASCS